MSVKGITPYTVVREKVLNLPDEVIGVFNAMIAENWSGSSSRVVQNEAVSRVAAALGISREAVFSLRYMDVEDFYRELGWKVQYDKPGYNESYKAYFVFSKK